MIFYIIRFLIMYIILAILCYFLYWRIDFKFYKKEEGEITLNYSEKKMLFIAMSIL